MPNIMLINGNTKNSGFIHGALDVIAAHLEAKGAAVSRLELREKQINDCLGCFNCLKTGECLLDDDIRQIVPAMLAADGLVVGSPVRNGNLTALYKRFYERITYRLGFPLLLEDKHILALSCVGYMSGKKINKKYLGLQDVFHARLSGFSFYSVGIPTRLTPESVAGRLKAAAEKLLADIQNGKKRGLLDNLAFTLDRVMLKKIVLKKNPEQYANVIRLWREKGYYKD